jgi:hypothetical protein
MLSDRLAGDDVRRYLWEIGPVGEGAVLGRESAVFLVGPGVRTLGRRWEEEGEDDENARRVEIGAVSRDNRWESM